MVVISQPKFLDLMDSAPEEAFDSFYRYAYQELTTTPPRPLKALNYEDQQDLIHEVIYHCVSDNFRILRQYKDVGKSFGCWLYRIAHNVALDYLRRKKRRWPIAVESNSSEDNNLIDKLSSNPGIDENRRYELMDVISKVRKALSKIGNRCRLLLEMAADEYNPMEMAGVLGLGKEMNKKISDDLRYCREKLKNLLATNGLSVEDFISGLK